MKKYYYLNENDIENIGGLIAPDEKFELVEEMPGWFISNYARLISTRKNGTAQLLQTVFKQGYESIATNIDVNGKNKSKCYALHKLVADAFVPVPEWVHENDITEVHHIKKVNREKRDLKTHYASNLTRLPVQVHKMVDKIAEIAVYKNGKYKTMDFVSAAFNMQISPYTLNQLIREQPSKKDGVYRVFDCSVNEKGVIRNVKFRITYRKDLKKILQN